MNSALKYIYGPVSSWRLGVSLGIDLFSQAEKICTFDCSYCQIGRAQAVSTSRQVYIPTQEIVRELKALPDVKIDCITLAGRGEPCLAENLGEMIVAVKAIMSKPVAVLTNATLLDRDDVIQELALADVVAVKLDAWSKYSLSMINNPAAGITFDRIYQGIKRFRQEYHGQLAVQMMFVPENKEAAERMAELAFEIKPDEVQINTPLRPCEVSPLSCEEIFKIKGCFQGLKTISVYDTKHGDDEPISVEDTVRRRGEARERHKGREESK
ncbi:radical SAM protein [Candidatus Desantisbacteria bacterium]|nr:radical SAM protein [Candidatus Desantisbacteria bacterium]